MGNCCCQVSGLLYPLARPFLPYFRSLISNGLSGGSVFVIGWKQAKSLFYSVQSEGGSCFKAMYHHFPCYLRPGSFLLSFIFSIRRLFWGDGDLHFDSVKEEYVIVEFAVELPAASG